MAVRHELIMQTMNLEGSPSVGEDRCATADALRCVMAQYRPFLLVGIRDTAEFKALLFLFQKQLNILTAELKAIKALDSLHWESKMQQN